MSVELQQIKDALDGIVDSSSNLDVLMEFEEVLDNLHMYSYQNWEYGEVLAGPEVSRYWISVSLMYPYKKMPDPDGALRLIKHGARVFFYQDELEEGVKITKPEDLGPADPKTGRRKPKMKKTKVWVVVIEMPREFVDESESDKVTINGVDIDMSEVDGAYDSDQDNDIAPDKNEIMDELE